MQVSADLEREKCSGVEPGSKTCPNELAYIETPFT